MEPDLKLAAALFDSLSSATRRGRGIVRDSYGAGEQAAHDLMRAAAETMDLEVSIDAIGNLMMTLPGRDPFAPRIIIGSHLDSVPQGGNYDGAAGVVAVLCAMSSFKRAGTAAACDITVMGIRGGAAARRGGDRHQRMQTISQRPLRRPVRSFRCRQSPASPRRGGRHRGAAAPYGDDLA